MRAAQARAELGALETLLSEAGAPAHRIELALRATRRMLEEAVRVHEDGSVYVLTGDIPAMWLRDSAAQVRPLLALAGDVPAASELVSGVLRTQIEQVLLDPYANAFFDRPHRVFERKYELDSLCAPLSLAWLLWRTTGSRAHVDGRFLEGAALIVELWRGEQSHDPATYSFRRHLARRTDSLPSRGRGRPLSRTGMTWSGFRPSDDACVYGYHIPANAFAAVSLDRLAELLVDDPVAVAARELGAEIRAGIEKHGIVDGIYAYEVDGLGGALRLDDANVPSLLSLPYLGFCETDDATYRATRAWILSPNNPSWVAGPIAGMGSTHGRRGWVWPLGIAIEGLTATCESELDEAARRIEKTVTGDLLIHESVDPTQPARFRRRWFSWADMLYVELVLASVGVRLPVR
jgi:meiotically up-regulated gene 157 (Mug157) protein